MFTGDRSGDWLFGALHRAGLATRPESVHRDDGLQLEGAWLTAAVRCAPPANKPSAKERDRCLPYLERELLALEGLRVIVALGGFAWDSVLRALRAIDWEVPSPKPRFGHEAEATVARPSREPDGVRKVVLLGSYHPSQQNTFTGRLTEEMFDSVWRRAVEIGG
jgi:uracil-DNA glycosylase